MNAFAHPELCRGHTDFLPPIGNDLATGLDQSLLDHERCYGLNDLALSDVVRLGRAVRQSAQAAESMEEVANRIVRYFYEAFRDPVTGESEIALARFFKSHSYEHLEPALKTSADALASPQHLSDHTKCLVLLATAGLCPDWNSRHASQGHQAIPLVSEEAVSGIPMISQLIQQFGLPLNYVIDAAPELMIELDERSYNVFHVEEALNSPYIPAQANFVKPFGIRSVLGFGGMLPTGNLFAVILFAKTRIPAITCEAFRTIAVSIKTAILPFEDMAVFAGDDNRAESLAAAQKLPNRLHRMALFRSKSAALEELGNVYDHMVIEQSSRLEQTVNDLEASNLGLAAEIEHRKQLEADRERLYGQLMIASRHAGMAEIASGVLHNVGNVLNSVNVSASLVHDLLRKSQIDQLNRVCDLLDQHRQDLGDFVTTDAKGKQIPGFLKALAGHLAQERATVVREIESLTTQVEHIKTIVTTQQSYAGVSGVVEPVCLQTLLDDAVKMNSSSFQRHGIVIERDDQNMPDVLVDKQKVLQILINLVKNAKDAVLESAAQPRTIRLTSVVDDHQLRISISDTGSGIAPEYLTQIFRHGFTTKKLGHGFGLHVSANAAREMQGNLTVVSAGLGQGATFTLELPFRPANQALASPAFLSGDN